MPKKIFIASGGTGGHIIPARCLAKYLTEHGSEVIFCGDKKYLSYTQEADQFKFKIITSSQIQKSPIFLFKAALKIIYGIAQSLLLFAIYRPKYIVAFGGYSTFPLLIAAIITKTKIILHEQNSHLGKVNRIFAKNAQTIALSFKNTSGIRTKFLNKTVFVGNPFFLYHPRSVF